jgi:hypothetical protein
MGIAESLYPQGRPSVLRTGMSGPHGTFPCPLLQGAKERAQQPLKQQQPPKQQQQQQQQQQQEQQHSSFEDELSEVFENQSPDAKHRG